MDALRRKRGNRPTTMKDLSKDTAGRRARWPIFDLDGTIMSTNVIEQYLWARLPELARGRPAGRGRPGASAGCRPTCAPSSATAARFLRAVYRRYGGADLAELEQSGRHDDGPAHPEPAVAGRASAGSASTGPPGTPRS